MGRIATTVGLLLVATTAVACASDKAATPATTRRATTTTAAPAAASTTTQPTTTQPTTTSTTTTTTPPLAAASYRVSGGPLQITVLDATPGDKLSVHDQADTSVADGTVDEQGSLLFRNLAIGTGFTVQSAEATSTTVDVSDPAVPPDAGFYSSQPKLPQGGFGYITTRDGTTLSANIVLPGPAEQGPYPTVVEYSGYQPSDPDSANFARIYTTMGFAYVGVNMRGSGCSGGSYRFFEKAQLTDGYDVIETVAAQPWVMNNKVGMVGISYPGISQLFVASMQPPSLEAITPLSVIDDSYRGNLYPGGILNTGFAVSWTQARVDEAKPFGQAWTKKRADAGDTVCADNQKVRLQNPELTAEIDASPFYANPLGDSLAPITFVDKIDVPMFIAGAWQDEQTGGHFPAMLDKFTGSPHVYIDLVNGLHTESLSPAIFQRYAEFLQLYVAKRLPDMTAPNAIVPVLGKALWGVDQLPALTNRFDGQTYEQALAAFEAEPQVQLLVEQGGAKDLAPGTPWPNFVLNESAWPIPEAKATSWFLSGAGGLLDAPAVSQESSYTAKPDALPATYFDDKGDSNSIWRAGAVYDWRPLPDGTGLGFITLPLTSDTMIAGSGSVDLWIKSTTPDTDLEVTISEVRPDGKEIYVQSGWLRASQRKLDEAASTELRPVHTHAEADASPLPPGKLTPVRVELLSFAHPFRAGSRLRLTIDAPGNDRPVWVFKTISAGETVTIAHDADHPSKLVLAVVPGVDIPNAAPPACGSLRGQPCRDYVAASNGG